MAAIDSMMTCRRSNRCPDPPVANTCRILLKSLVMIPYLVPP
jgi:hypothetical protein